MPDVITSDDNGRSQLQGYRWFILDTQRRIEETQGHMFKLWYGETAQTAALLHLHQTIADAEVRMKTLELLYGG